MRQKASSALEASYLLQTVPKLTESKSQRAWQVILDDTTATCAGGRNVQNDITAFLIFPICLKIRCV